MANKNVLDIEVVAEDLASKVIENVRHKVDSLSRTTSSQGTPSFLKLTSAMATGTFIAQSAIGVFSSLTDTVSGLNSKVIDMGKNFIITGINTSASLETAEIGLGVLLGSAEKASKTIARIKTEAARTPFGIEGLTRATQLLSSVTKDGDKSVDILLDVGESLSAMGKGTEELDRLVVNLQQVGATGRASMMDIRQFAYAGIPIFELLQEETKLSGDALSNFVADGKVSFELLTKVFDKATSKGGRFFGAFEKAGGSFNQLVSNMKDNFAFFASDFVKRVGIFDLVKNGISKLNEVFEKAKPFIDEFATGFREGIAMPLKRVTDLLSMLANIIKVRIFGESTMQLSDFTAKGQQMGEIVGNAIETLTGHVVGFVGGFLTRWNDLKNNFISIGQSVVDILGQLGSSFGTLTNTTGVTDGSMDSLGSNMGTTVAGAAVNLTNAIRVLLKQLADPKSDLRKFIDGVNLVGKTIFDVTKKVIDLINKVNKLIETIRIFKRESGTATSGQGLDGGASSTISGKRALGGSVVAGKSYIVGEQGREIFTPNISGSIIPNNRTNDIINNSNSNINIVVNVSGGNPYAIVETIKRELANANRSARLGLNPSLNL